VTGKKLQIKILSRRAGDPPRLVGNSRQARLKLGFGEDLATLSEIISSAWAWDKKRRGVA
jgi:UDP-glucose 4-epimerase